VLTLNFNPNPLNPNPLSAHADRSRRREIGHGGGDRSGRGSPDRGRPLVTANQNDDSSLRSPDLAGRGGGEGGWRLSIGRPAALQAPRVAASPAAPTQPSTPVPTPDSARRANPNSISPESTFPPTSPSLRPLTSRRPSPAPPVPMSANLRPQEVDEEAGAARASGSSYSARI